MGSYIAALIASMLVVSPALVLAQQPQAGPPARRSITRITGDLYRVQNNDHYTVFLVTPAGIILADPINVDAAAWIKAQLAERFPNAPVRYVLYSHHHQDHASGAAVFNDTAELVGHQNFAAALKASATVKRSGREAVRRGRATRIHVHRSADCYVGRQAGRSDSSRAYGPRARHDGVVLSPERVVFGVDFVNVKTVPGSNTLANGASITEYVNALKVVDALDFDIVAPGHGPTGEKRTSPRTGGVTKISRLEWRRASRRDNPSRRSRRRRSWTNTRTGSSTTRTTTSTSPTHKDAERREALGRQPASSRRALSSTPKSRSIRAKTLARRRPHRSRYAISPPESPRCSLPASRS